MYQLTPEQIEELKPRWAKAIEKTYSPKSPPPSKEAPIHCFALPFGMIVSVCKMRLDRVRIQVTVVLQDGCPLIEQFANLLDQVKDRDMLRVAVQEHNRTIKEFMEKLIEDLHGSKITFVCGQPAAGVFSLSERTESEIAVHDKDREGSRN